MPKGSAAKYQSWKRVNRLNTKARDKISRRERLRYRVDLVRYMAECDANYHRLLKLFPALRLGGERALELDQALATAAVVIRVLENTPYTSLLRLTQRSDRSSPWDSSLELEVRLYHDARTAEVVNNEGKARPQPRYGYPNNRMYQQDEKAQWNLFLGEWLSHCLAHGRSVEPVYRW